MIGMTFLALVLQVTAAGGGGAVEMTAGNRKLIAEWAAEASKTGDGNANVLALDRKLKAAFGYEPQSAGHVLLSNGAITLALTTSLDLYRTAFVEAMRMMEPAPPVPSETGIVVMVSPRQIDAPDIVKIVVQRDGTTVPPLRIGLSPTPFETRMGAKDMLGAGEIVFPAAAFLPGARVTVTFIPRTGGNLVFSIPAHVLANLR